jgi:hypothetical protein
VQTLVNSSGRAYFQVRAPPGPRPAQTERKIFILLPLYTVIDAEDGEAGGIQARRNCHDWLRVVHQARRHARQGANLFEIVLLVEHSAASPVLLPLVRHEPYLLCQRRRILSRLGGIVTLRQERSKEVNSSTIFRAKWNISSGGDLPQQEKRTSQGQAGMSTNNGRR